MGKTVKKFLVLFIILILGACNGPPAAIVSSGDNEKPPPSPTLILSEGTTMQTRILPPPNYERIGAPSGSFLEFMRNQEMKEDGSPVVLYNGKEKRNQDAHTAVFAFDAGDRDLQQCADSIIRIYAEYFWSVEEYQKIRFHLTNGFLMDYLSWQNGSRLQVEGNSTNWVKSRAYEDSYQSFRDYLTTVMIYAGTISLDEESVPISYKDLQAGDLLLVGGSPGHCVLIADVAINAEGKKCCLLAQGFMPAQEFHILKNPQDDSDPWYYEDDLASDVHTPEFLFEEGSMQRWKGLE